MELVHVTPKSFNDYLPFVDEAAVEEIRTLAAGLAGKKIAMINATAFGGGVAEKLHSLVPLLKDLGLDLDWWVMKGDNDFYQVTKQFHNRLQGQEGELTRDAVQIYLDYNRANAGQMEGWDYEIVVVHDPQPAALINYHRRSNRTAWIWRCHIDTSTPNPEYWNFLYDYIRQYDAAIFTACDFVKADSHLNNLTLITPSIDPLSVKNIKLEPEQAKGIVCRFGIDGNRPLISQISRFDPWKD
ncbi:MAG TPA: glycosyl transferase family 1, partial [Candidatus Moranbacteria bacterium]|nr:glycosyl transferase family 1 [Candidatus Moranbacteria bacterium]